jgi:hyaluronoglucosaminidase
MPATAGRTTFGVRGIIEGFYGRLWTWEQRARVVDVAVEAGFTTYAYAPKEDRLQNAEWRTPYPADTLASLAALRSRCETGGMELWIGLRPVGISYADEADLLRVVERLRRYLDLGAGRLVLLADDIPATLEARSGGRFSRLVDAHLWLIDEVLRRLKIRPRQLVFVPTDYHGFGSPYLERLGRALPPEVDVCWTGAGVFAPTISVDQATHIGAVLHRPPLIWDNYPVNDEADRHDLRIGPIRGRDEGLPAVTRGILVNPAQEPEATLVPILTWGEYLADPPAYHAGDAWRRALRRIAGPEPDAELVATLAAGLDRSCIDQGWERPPEVVVDAARRRIGALTNRSLADDLARF